MIYQLDLFSRKQGKWTDTSYVQAFVALYQDPDLRASCRMCVATNQSKKLPAEKLDDCLNWPPLNKPRLLEETQAIPDKGEQTLSLSLCSSNRPRLL